MHFGDINSLNAPTKIKKTMPNKKSTLSTLIKQKKVRIQK